MYCFEPMAHQPNPTGFMPPPSAPKENWGQVLRDIALNKSQDSFIHLFEYFAPRIKSYLIKSGLDPAQSDELAQETMLSVWNNSASFDPAKAAASTWIFTIARNKRIDLQRKSRGENTGGFSDTAAENWADPAESASDALIQSEETSTLYDALQSLPAEQSDLIRRSFFDEKSHQEIAEETGLPLGTIKSRIRLGLERLRRQKGVKDLWH